VDVALDDTVALAAARAIDSHGLLAPGARVVVAVSGGPDSVALALALKALSEDPARGYAIELAHLDHGIRGAQSEADARFVTDLAARLRLPLTSECRPVLTAERPPRGRKTGSLEAAARRVRYEFLREVAERTGADAVAVGHTRDDQVETILLRLLRGATLSDLGGMRPSRPLTADGRARLVRPLLDIGRREVLAFLSARHMPFREDCTNRDTRYLRNRVRHDLLPLLEERYNPGIRQALLDVGAAARTHATRLDGEAQRLLANADVRCEARSVSLPVRMLAGAEASLREALLRRAVARVSREPALSQKALARVDGLTAAGRGTWVPLGGGLRARRSDDRIIVEAVGHRDLSDGRPAPPVGPITLSRAGATALPPFGITIEVKETAGQPDRLDRGPDAALLDARALRGALFVRNRRAGDRFRPLGAPGTRTLKEVLIDRKVPADRRDVVPVICDEAGIVWVVGVSIADRVRVTAATRRTLSLVMTTMNRKAAP